MKPLYHKGKVQAWIDPKGIQHAVCYRAEPRRLSCLKTPMWSYQPRLAEIADITCEKCVKEMDIDI